jgi:hypothetical protein
MGGKGLKWMLGAGAIGCISRTHSTGNSPYSWGAQDSPCFGIRCATAPVGLSAAQVEADGLNVVGIVGQHPAAKTTSLIMAECCILSTSTFAS